MNTISTEEPLAYEVELVDDEETPEGTETREESPADDVNPVSEEKKVEEIVESAANPTSERDFDKDPTLLYLLIQKKQWNETRVQAEQCPEEARIWVSRKEKDGRLRWKLLPIHAAIVFKAPEDVVESLLAAYPKGAQAKDDQGMLPLHLAFRNGSTEGIVNLLLVAYPKSIEIKDRKGRIPLVLAQASTSPNREAFMRALERGPTYYAVAAAATERAAVTAEQRAIFDAKLMQVRQSHQHDITQLRIDYDAKQRELEEKLAATEKELAKTQKASQVLVDHVQSLEAQLSSRSDTERFLATKIATLDSNLKNTNKDKEQIEANLRSETLSLQVARDELMMKLEDVEDKYITTKERLDRALELIARKEREYEIAEKKLTSQIKTIEIDWANSQANCAILDAQLKKKVETEHALATQVSALAGKLAESAAEARDNGQNYSSRIRGLEEERQHLRESVKDLTKRLSMVARMLEEMTKQQQKVMEEAKVHETKMAEAAALHAKIVADAQRQEQAIEKVKKEREQVRQWLEKQDAKFEEGAKERANIMTAIALQGQQMDDTKKDRDQIVESVSKIGDNFLGLMSAALDGIPTKIDDEDEIVDEVLQKLAPVKENEIEKTEEVEAESEQEVQEKEEDPATTTNENAKVDTENNDSNEAETSFVENDHDNNTLEPVMTSATSVSDFPVPVGETPKSVVGEEIDVPEPQLQNETEEKVAIAAETGAEETAVEIEVEAGEEEQPQVDTPAEKVELGEGEGPADEVHQTSEAQETPEAAGEVTTEEVEVPEISTQPADEYPIVIPSDPEGSRAEDDDDVPATTDSDRIEAARNAM